MLVATITTLLLIFGGGTWGGLRGYLSEMDKTAKQVPDKQRRERARAIVKRMEKEYDEFEKGVVEHRKKILVVDSNYKSTAADYRKVFLALDTMWEESERDIIQNLLEFRKNVTREQWEAMYLELDKKREQAEAKKR